MLEKWLEWYYTRYHQHGNTRFISFLHSLMWLLTHTDENRIIVETGTQRQDDDLGAGESTRIFSSFCSEFGGKLISIDNNAQYIKYSKTYTIQYKECIEYICADSVDALSDLDLNIDLLYLDSLDYLDGWHTMSENHCLSEAEIALPKMADNSLILIDDFNEQGIGKGRLARVFLIKNGWVEFFRSQQGIYIYHENFG